MSDSVFDKPAGITFEPAPAGTHIAICTQIIDLGTQHWTYLGEAKSGRKLRITFELPDEILKYEDADGNEVERPFVVMGEHTVSLHEKANLRKVLESWRGKKFTDEQLEPFRKNGLAHLKGLLGVMAMVNVVHTEKGENTYANIASISPPPKGTARREPSVEPVFFSLEPQSFSKADLDRLSPRTKEKILKTDEYKALALQVAKPPAKEPIKKKTPTTPDDVDLNPTAEEDGLTF